MGLLRVWYSNVIQFQFHDQLRHRNNDRMMKWIDKARKKWKTYNNNLLSNWLYLQCECYIYKRAIYIYIYILLESRRIFKCNILHWFAIQTWNRLNTLTPYSKWAFFTANKKITITSDYRYIFHIYDLLSKFNFIWKLSTCF